MLDAVRGPFLARYSRDGICCVAGGRRFAGARTPLANASGTWLAAHVASSLRTIRKTECPVSLAGADSRALAPHSLTRAGPGSLLTSPAPCALFAKRNVPCRWPAPARGGLD